MTQPIGPNRWEFTDTVDTTGTVDSALALESKKGSVVVFVSMASAGIEPHECACIVRLDSDPPPITAVLDSGGTMICGSPEQKDVSEEQPHEQNAEDEHHVCTPPVLFRSPPAN